MSLREFAENKEFYKKKGKITNELDNILLEFGNENNFKMSEDDMKFIEEWNLLESYLIYKSAYESRR